MAHSANNAFNPWQTLSMPRYYITVHDNYGATGKTTQLIRNTGTKSHYKSPNHITSILIKPSLTCYQVPHNLQCPSQPGPDISCWPLCGIYAQPHYVLFLCWTTQNTHFMSNDTTPGPPWTFDNWPIFRNSNIMSKIIWPIHWSDHYFWLSELFLGFFSYVLVFIYWFYFCNMTLGVQKGACKGQLGALWWHISIICLSIARNT